MSRNTKWMVWYAFSIIVGLGAVTNGVLWAIQAYKEEFLIFMMASVVVAVLGGLLFVVTLSNIWNLAEGRPSDQPTQLRTGVVYTLTWSEEVRIIITYHFLGIFTEVDSKDSRFFSLLSDQFNTTDFPDQFILHRGKDGKFIVREVKRVKRASEQEELLTPTIAQDHASDCV